MTKKTPLQEVKERFGSKEELAKQLLAVAERPEGIEDDEFERILTTSSNKQLLRLHTVTETVKKRFGSKEALVDAIVDRTFPKGNPPYRTKLLGLKNARLLDLHQSL